jgi:hypothetical protein
MALLAPLLLALSIGAQSARLPSTRVEENDTESLGTAKHANCDYGFCVSLPQGFVGHGSHSPNPHHGFLVGLPETGCRMVNAEYDSYDLKFLSKAAARETGIAEKGKQDFKVLKQSDAKLNRLPAARLRWQYGATSGIVIEEKVVALRAEIPYELGLRTTYPDYLSDGTRFNRIVEQFRWWEVHNCP